MPSAYVIAHVDVTNPEQYEQYKVLSSAAMKAHGAEVCVRGGAVEVLEGDWAPERLVMLKFPSVAAARTFRIARIRDSPQGARGRRGHAHDRGDGRRLTQPLPPHFIEGKFE